MKKQIENSVFIIDEKGVVSNTITQKIISKRINQKGYECFNLFINGKCRNFKTHRLLGICFILNPNNYPCINHIDGNKLNNCLSNLEWCTLSYNTTHAYKLGLIKPNRKFSSDQEKDILSLINTGLSQRKVGELFNTSQQVIFNIIKRNKLVGQNS